VALVACGPSTTSGDDDDTTGSDGGAEPDARGAPLVRDFIDPSLSPSVVADFDGLSLTPGLDLVYPNASAAIPRDLAAIDVQADPSSGHDVYRVTFAVDTGDALRGFVPNPSWVPDESDWTWLMSRAAGQEISLTMAGADDDGAGGLTGGRVSDAQPLFVSWDDATGALFYFATTGDQTSGEGTLERLEVGSRAPDKYLNKSNSGGNCVGCHTLSRDGAQLSFTLMDALYSLSTALAAAEDPTAQTPAQGASGANGAFNPDGTRLLMSSRGQLELYDTSTGAKISNVTTSGPALFPDWSWDGSTIVFVQPEALCVPGLLNFGQDSIFVYGGSIVTMDYDGSSFSNEQVILAADSSYSNYYPSFSPDGSWIALSRASRTSPSSWDLAATACEGKDGAGVSYDNPSATVWVVSPDGGALHQLSRANEAPMLTNSWPRWAPKADGERLWLSMSSTREYGTRLTGAAAHHQLWFTAVRKPGEPFGDDPSSPAVWFPFQSLDTKNHLGQWSLKVGDFVIE
jgi:Tol biopolymer transport system component